MQDLEHYIDSNKNKITDIQESLDKKVDTQHFIDELDYFKQTTAQVNEQFNDALSEVSDKINPDPIKRSSALVRSAGMNIKEKGEFRKVVRDVERVL